VHTRKKNGIKQHLVKRIGYDETFNNWKNATNIRKYNESIYRNIDVR